MANEDKIQEILLKMIGMEGQLSRLVSDAESEKEVRKRLTDDSMRREEERDKRIRVLEDYANSERGKAIVNSKIIAVLCTVIAGLILWLITKK